MNENILVKEYKLNKPFIQKIESLIDNSIRDCHNKCFHTFDHICEYDLSFTSLGTDETVNFTLSDICMGLYELNKKLTVARGVGFLFDRMNKLTIKIYSNQRYMNIQYYLKFPIPMCHRQFFRNLSQNQKYIQTHCNDRRNPFPFACSQWYLYNNPQCNMV